jgi:D-alanine-D-alanine ligase
MVGVTLDGRWTLGPEDPAVLRPQGSTLPKVVDSGPEVLPPNRVGSTEWRLVHSDGRITSLGSVDVVFPLFHGPFGEDGTVQGLLELTDQRYVGAGVLASALGMDKGYTKCLLEAHGLQVVPYTVITPADWIQDQASALERAHALGWPLFVKPCRAGSSLGISKVEQPQDLIPAIETAAQHDPRVLVESAAVGREIECAVLGSPAGAPARASLPSEIVVRGEHQFYDFEAKYLDQSGADLRCPADLDPEVTQAVRSLAVSAFHALGAEGLARVDFFYNPDAPSLTQLTVNEVNTMPGFTPISQYPQMWQASGLSYRDLVTELIQLALDRPTGLR